MTNELSVYAPVYATVFDVEVMVEQPTEDFPQGQWEALTEDPIEDYAAALEVLSSEQAVMSGKALRIRQTVCTSQTLIVLRR